MNVFDERISDEQLARIVLRRLSPRELNILWMASNGKSTKQISYTLGLSNRSIDAHRYNLRKKINLRGVAELAILGWRIRSWLKEAIVADDATRVQRVVQDALTT